MGDTGLTADEERTLKRLNRLPLKETMGFIQLSTCRVAAILKGRWAERRFLSAWKEVDFSGYGIMWVLRACKHADTYEETDAVIVLKTGFQVRIQIKSRIIGHDEFRSYARRGIVAVGVGLDEPPEVIRQNTINACVLYNHIYERDVICSHSSI
jgi:hypothetical protein